MDDGGFSPKAVIGSNSAMDVHYGAWQNSNQGQTPGRPGGVMRIASTVLLLTLLSVLPASRQASAHAGITGGCAVEDLSAVFADPMKYRGQKFCGAVYYYGGDGFYGFYDRPLADTSPGSMMWKVVLLAGTSGLSDADLTRLKTGDQIFIEGTIEPDEFCFKGGKCTPFEKPIFIENLRLVERR